MPLSIGAWKKTNNNNNNNKTSNIGASDHGKCHFNDKKFG